MLQFNIIYLELYDVEMLITIHLKIQTLGSYPRKKNAIKSNFLIIRSGQ